MKRVFVIREAANGYELVDETNKVVGSHTNPRRLSDLAFDMGAHTVTHAYDLIKAEGR